MTCVTHHYACDCREKAVKELCRTLRPYLEDGAEEITARKWGDVRMWGGAIRRALSLIERLGYGPKENS